MIIHAVLDEDCCSKMGGNAYIGIVRTRIWELEKLKKAEKITNLEIKNLAVTQQKKKFSFSLDQKHDYSAVVTNRTDGNWAEVHMMRTGGDKEVRFLVPRNPQTVKETKNAIIITI